MHPLTNLKEYDAEVVALLVDCARAGGMVCGCCGKRLWRVL